MADIILLNTPETEPILKNLFSFYAPYYNLEEYERITTGGAATIHEMFVKEREWQEGKK